MAAITYIDAMPSYNRIGDNVVMTLSSNGEKIPFVMPLSTFATFARATMREVEAALNATRDRAQQADVVAFPKRKHGKAKA